MGCEELIVNCKGEIFINKLNDNISINIETLKHDIEIYTNFEKYRKYILKEIKK